MSQKRSDEKRTTARRVADTALDVAIGGTALAADKAVDTAVGAIDRVVSGAEGAVRKGRRAVREGATALGKADVLSRDADSRAYEERTRDELYQLAAEREIEGRSNMRKEELIEALRAER